MCIPPSDPSYARTLTPCGTMVKTPYPTGLSPPSELLDFGDTMDGANETDCPAILYHYRSMKRGLEELQTGRLRLCHPSDFQDPNDTWGVYAGDSRVPISNQMFECLLEEMRNEQFVVSMCDSYNYRRMWDEYSEGHSGICIGYDVARLKDSKLDTYEVIYTDQLPSCPDRMIFGGMDTFLLEAGLYKGTAYSHEHEWRIQRRYWVPPKEDAIFEECSSCIACVYIGLNAVQKYHSDVQSVIALCHQRGIRVQTIEGDSLIDERYSVLSCPSRGQSPIADI